MGRRVLAAVAVGVLLAGCAAASSGNSASVVFEEVTHTVRTCPDPVEPGTDCLVVEATVVGLGVGTGSCVVYAAGEEDTVGARASSPTWELRPGTILQWQVEVTRPPDPHFRGWNPHCEPMIEG